MMIAHRIALDPNSSQRAYFGKAAGVSRFAYNWALEEWNRQHQAGEKPSEGKLRKQLNALKREQFPWMLEVTKCASQEAIIDLGQSFKRFFSKIGRYPKFKAKGKSKDAFCAANEAGTFQLDNKKLRLPIVGWVRIREPLRFAGTPKRVTISRVADRWFASILVEAEDLAPIAHPKESVGVDLGVKTLATLSDGTVIAGPKAHTALLKRLRRSNKALSRKQRGSKNSEKSRRRLARLHARISNIRKDAMHKATTMIAKTYRRIGIEDLNVSGMVRNRRLARSIMDRAFGMFRQQIEYKARLYGAEVVKAGRFWPSSKTCSCCGSVKELLKLSERTFNCDDCGASICRDLNAAKNLEMLAVGFTVSACGEGSSGAARKPRVKLSSKKQEPNIGMRSNSSASCAALENSEQ